MLICPTGENTTSLNRLLSIVYIIFICGFFALSHGGHRNFYYIAVLLPFFALLYKERGLGLSRSKIFLMVLIYLFYMCFTLFWADAVTVEDVYNCVRKSLLTLSFVCISVYLINTNSEFLPQVFKWSCLFSGLMAIFWIISFYYIDGHHGRVGSLGGRNVPTQAGNVYALMALITWFCFIFKIKILSYRFLLYCCVGLSLFAFVFLTGSRGPLLSFASILLFCSLLVYTKKSLVVSGCFALLVTGLFLFKIFDFSSLLKRGSSFRPTIWWQSFDLWLAKPILGYGYGGGRPDIVFGNNYIANHSHNVFISNALDGGLLSVLVLVFMLVLSGYWTLCYFKKQHDITPFALVLFAVVSNLTDGRTLIMSPGFQWLCFWLPISIAVALELAQKQSFMVGFRGKT